MTLQVGVGGEAVLGRGIGVGAEVGALGLKEDLVDTAVGVTTGIYSLVRHPLYSAWIVLLIPGVVLLSRCWLLFLTPLVAYCAFKKLIRREDEYLQHRFGRT